MQLPDAIRQARLDKRLSQKKLSELAGIQRRQLAVLEGGGNVTLTTLKKVLRVLDNLEEFTLDAFTVRVDQSHRPPIDIDRLGESMTLFGSALKAISERLAAHELPTAEDHALLRRTNVHIMAGLPPENRARILGQDAPKFADEIAAELARREKEDLAAVEPEEFVEEDTELLEGDVEALEADVEGLGGEGGE